MSNKKRRTGGQVGRKRGEWRCMPLAADSSIWVFIKPGASDRELLVGNLDSTHTDNDVKVAFEHFGAVDRVEMDPIEGQAGGALVVFETAAGAAAACDAEELALAAEGSAPVRGLQRWAAECQGRMRPAERLQQQVNAFMAEFDAREAEAARDAQREVVDDDGFTLVSKARGKRGVTDGNVHVRTAASRAKRARADPQEAFYGLQKLKARQQAVRQLRAKFEADKKRLQQMKNRKSL